MFVHKGETMSADLQNQTIEMMLYTKQSVSIKEALSAIGKIDSLMQTRDKRLSPITLKYQVRLHVKSAA